MNNTETIVAQATATGRGGVGIIRVSGPAVEEVATKILGKLPKPRVAELLNFYDENRQTIDEGIALYFKGPNSFTGENVLELQGHGGPVIIDMLIRAILTIDNVRLAKPGEFSERAFLNDKLDLTQAEAIADLIDSSSEQAARSALNSLQGKFSSQINELLEQIIHLRMYVEAAIDFPEEEIDFLSDATVSEGVNSIVSTLSRIQEAAQQGAIIRDGMKVVIAGRPNAGKSSLLNSLAGKESAIVTDIEGTTRDVLREHIHIDGMPLHIIDTAGLRESDDEVERIGIQRAWEEIKQADQILLLVDATQSITLNIDELLPEFFEELPDKSAITIVQNKVDLVEDIPKTDEVNSMRVLQLSAKTGLGVQELKQYLKACMGYQDNSEGTFTARRRHLDALIKAEEHVFIGKEQLEVHRAGELLAEELRIAQQYLSEITGEFTADDLLTQIFSSFCIGK